MAIKDPADVPYHCFFSHFEPSVYAVKHLANESGLNEMLMSFPKWMAIPLRAESEKSFCKRVSVKIYFLV
jgi:hypothetical protein